MKVVARGVEHESLVAALFEAAACPCHCRYWHFTGDKNAWLQRCAEAPEESRREQETLVASGDPAGRGLLALEGDRALGWMKLSPRSTLPKMNALPVYRNLALGAGGDVYVVGCLLVHPAHRHRGVARVLITAAEGFVKGWGGVAVEGYPRRATEHLHDEEAWRGPEALFTTGGFRTVHDEGPYPVYRKDLP